MNDFINELTTLIADRKTNPKPGSYTNKLLADKNKAAQKVGEEATEVIIAALAQSDERVIEEMADLIYHSLVLLETRGLSWSDVVAALEKRHR
ncbi:MAG: phosphoribosyl-ATP diphosphatase [Anaerolineaceae bacterium]|nr:phosphoribosyl-ATP diphosphatase [Anaerolineaceae bacterium]